MQVGGQPEQAGQLPAVEEEHPLGDVWSLSPCASCSCTNSSSVVCLSGQPCTAPEPHSGTSWGTARNLTHARVQCPATLQLTCLMLRASLSLSQIGIWISSSREFGPLTPAALSSCNASGPAAARRLGNGQKHTGHSRLDLDALRVEPTAQRVKVRDGLSLSLSLLRGSLNCPHKTAN